MKHIITLLLLITFLISCKPDEPTVCPPSETTNVLWKFKMHPNEDKSCATTKSPTVLEKDIIFDATWCGENGESIIYRLDGLTGEKKWHYSDAELFDYYGSLSVINNKLAISTSGTNGILDLESGELDWSSHLNYEKYIISTFEDNIFCVTGSGFPNVHSELHASHYESENYIKIFETDSSNLFTVSMLPPIGYKNNDGDVILYIIDRGFNLDAVTLERLDLYAYNMTQNTLLWKKENLLCVFGTNSLGTNNLSQIYNDKMYVQSGQSLFCLDLETGEEYWSHCFLGESFNRTQNLIRDNVVVLNSESAKMFGVSTLTGEIIWTKDDGGYSWEGMAFMDGIVYYSDIERIVGLNIHTGQEVWTYDNDRSEYSDASFSSSLAINEELKILYATDHHYMIAISLEE